MKEHAMSPGILFEIDPVRALKGLLILRESTWITPGAKKFLAF
jgi:hypothetical protein